MLNSKLGGTIRLRFEVLKRVWSLLDSSSPLASNLAKPRYADQVFHTTRLTFFLTLDGTAAGQPQLKAGHVVDIHANGPKVGAIEQYMINGAEPKTSYQVVLRIFSKCGGDFLFPILTALLATNSLGFAHGSHLFTPADTAPFKSMTVGILWTLVSGDVTAYNTTCIPVTID